jgi:hypothetical protein
VVSKSEPTEFRASSFCFVGKRERLIKTWPEQYSAATRAGNVPELEGDVFVGDFGRGAGGVGLVSECGLIVVFGAGHSCTGSGSQAAAVASSAEHTKIRGDDFKTGALLAFLVLPLAGLDAAFDENQRTLLQILLSDFGLFAPNDNFVPLGALLTLAIAILVRFVGGYGEIGNSLAAGGVTSFGIATKTADEEDFVDGHKISS